MRNAYTLVKMLQKIKPSITQNEKKILLEKSDMGMEGGRHRGRAQAVSRRL